MCNDPKYVTARNRIHITNQNRNKDKSSGLKGKYYFIERPHLKESLDFWFEYFDTVSVWSAGEKYYVRSVVDIICDGRRPAVVMTRDHISNDSDSYHKPLSKFYKKVPGANETNTLILDNRVENFRRNRKNGVLIPDWDPELDEEDSNLLLFNKWIRESDLRNCSDVRTLDKSRIFNQKCESVFTHTRRDCYVKPSLEF